MLEVAGPVFATGSCASCQGSPTPASPATGTSPCGVFWEQSQTARGTAFLSHSSVIRQLVVCHMLCKHPDSPKTGLTRGGIHSLKGGGFKSGDTATNSACMSPCGEWTITVSTGSWWIALLAEGRAPQAGRAVLNPAPVSREDVSCSNPSSYSSDLFGEALALLACRGRGWDLDALPLSFMNLYWVVQRACPSFPICKWKYIYTCSKSARLSN